MSVNTGLKNIPSMKEMEIDNEIDKLLALSLSLHTEIDRPARVALAQERERAFGELYCNMSYEDKQQVLQRRCVGCKRISPGEEIFSSFFGMCECMWQRYVARTYQPLGMDPFDSSEENRMIRFIELGKIAQENLSRVDLRLDELIRKRSFYSRERERLSFLRKDVEADKTFLALSAGKNVIDRQEQIEKNKKKIANTKKISSGKKLKKITGW